MPLPRDYQYPVRQADVFNQQQPGKLIIDRLINQRAPYLQPERGEAILAPKTLIIAAHELADMQTAEFDNYLRQFANLERQGFTLYYLDSATDSVKPYEVHNPFHHKKLTHISPISRSALHDRLAHAGIPVDQAKLIFAHQLNNPPFTTRAYDSVAIIEARCFDQGPILREQTLHALSLEEALCLTVDDDHSLTQWQALIARLLSLDETESFFNLQVTTDQMPALAEAIHLNPKLEKHLASITLVLNQTIAFEGWPTLEHLIKTIKINAESSPQNFPAIFTYARNIESLEIVHYSTDGESIDLTNCFFPLLKNLTFDNNCIVAETIIEFFNKSPQLTFLDINRSDSMIDNTKLTYSDFVLPRLSLTTLLVRDAEFSTILLAKIIQASPLLTQVDFDSCRDLDQLSLAKSYAPSWQHFNSIDTDLPKKVTAQLLRNSASAQTLQLSLEIDKSLDLSNSTYPKLKHFTVIGDSDSLSRKTRIALPDASLLSTLAISGCNISSIATSFPQLKTLILKRSSVDPEKFSALLAGASISTFEVSDCALESKPFPGINFSAVTELKLQECRHIGTLLKQIMVQKPSLETFNLMGCQDYNKLRLNHYDFGTLHFFKTEVIAENRLVIHDILRTAQHLQHLILQSRDLLASIDCREFSLTRLKILEANNASLAPEAIEKLLADNKQLHTLTLKNFTNIPDFTSVTTLNALKKLIFCGSSIHATSLLTILMKAPLLIELDLTNCSFIGDFQFPELSRPSLTKLSLSLATIGNKDLKELLKACPNLTELSLDISEMIGGNLSGLNFNDGHFEHLEIFTFKRSLPSEFARQLLARAPKLSSKTRTLLQDHLAQSDLTPQELSLTDSDQPLKFTQYFKNAAIPVNHYRLTVSKHINALDSALTMEPYPEQTFQALAEIPREVNANELVTLEEGQISLYFIDSEEYLALPSLHAHERLAYLRIDPPQAGAHVEIYHCEEENLFYLKANKACALTIHFGVEIPTDIFSIQHDAVVQHPELQFLIALYHEKNLHPDLTTVDPKEVFLNVATGRIVGGACRFRAAAFLQNIAIRRMMGRVSEAVRARYLENDLHAFVEVSIDNGHTWQALNLGGVGGAILAENPWLDQQDEESLLDNDPDLVESSVQDVPALLTLPEYIQQLQSLDANKILLIFPNKTALASFPQQLQTELSQQQQPFFYIHSPDDFILLPQRLSLAEIPDHEGNYPLIAEKTPFNRLIDFLRSHEAESCTVIINWCNFSAKQIAQFNSLIEDDAPHLHGYLLGPLVNIISLSAKNHYRGTDFYSRHSHREKFPSHLIHSGGLYQAPIGSRDDGVMTIDLFNSSDWEALLIGQTQVTDTGFNFMPGRLLHAFATATATIVLKNAPWHNDAFQLFWQTLQRTGRIVIYQKEFMMPSTTRIEHAQGYENTALQFQTVAWFHGIPEVESISLNPTTLSSCYQTHRWVDEQLKVTAGLLAQSAGQALYFYVTADLALDQWLRLLNEIHVQQVIAHFYLAPGVSLPAQAQSVLPIMLPVTTQATTTPQATLIISTTPHDTAQSLYDQSRPDTLLLTITKVAFSECFLSTEDLRVESTHIHGREVAHPVLQALMNGQRVILKGDFSVEFIDAVASFFLPQPYFWNGHTKQSFKGELILVTEANQAFAYVPAKQRLLAKKMALPKQALKPTLHWQEPSTVLSATDFQQARITAIEVALATNGYVLIEGPTGAGKSTLLETLPTVMPTANFFYGEAQLIAWALNTAPSRKILTIDEANLATFRLNMFDDLLNNPPSIFINGYHYPLSPEHKIIFVGNPESYGGGRQSIDVLKRHCPKITLQALPPQCLVETILTPILSQLTPVNDDTIAQITALFLHRYQEFSQLCPITPRELRLMATLLVSHVTLFDEALIQKAHEIAQDVHNVLQPLSAPLTPSTRHNAVEKFVITESRQQAVTWFDHMFKLRTHKQTTQQLFLEGGLNGLLIEGPSGVGKSDLIRSQLKSRGFKSHEESSSSADDPRQVFYEIPAHADSEKQAELLLEAFHRGAIAVIHEFNSADTAKKLEGLLNGLMMGTDPTGLKAQNPGFLLISSQNPISFEGREPLSPAQQCRFVKITLENYKQTELLRIAQHTSPLCRRCPEALLTLVDHHLATQHEAEQDPLITSPNLRDLLRAVEKLTPIQLKRNRLIMDQDDEEQEAETGSVLLNLRDLLNDTEQSTSIQLKRNRLVWDQDDEEQQEAGSLPPTNTLTTALASFAPSRSAPITTAQSQPALVKRKHVAETEASEDGHIPPVKKLNVTSNASRPI